MTSLFSLDARFTALRASVLVSLLDPLEPGGVPERLRCGRRGSGRASSWKPRHARYTQKAKLTALRRTSARYRA